MTRSRLRRWKSGFVGFKPFFGKAGRRRPIWWIAVGFIVAVNVIALVVGYFAPTPGGPESSSFATGPTGIAAWAELLARSGHVVDASREPLDGDLPDRGTTLVVLDPESLDSGARENVTDFVGRGGRLIAGGSDASWTEDLVPGSNWSERPVREASVLVPAAETAGVAEVATTGTGSFASTGPALPLVGTGDGAVAAVASRGAGSIVLVGDPTFLQNSGLDRSDNAALAIGIAGPSNRPVVFSESVHGYTNATGLAALPDEWKWALGLAALAAFVMIAARARRIGPPDEAGRDVAPPRAAYVESMAGILGRTNRPDQAFGRLREEALDRAHVGDARDRGRVMTQLDLTEGERRVLEYGVRTESDGVLAAKALAKMRKRFGGDR
jgi:hypothetical protein